MDDDGELILVDDGSPDQSLAIACRLAMTEQRIIVVQLSRNFGHHRAILEGLKRATGDRIFLVDSDLEEPPELLTEFSRIMDGSNADVVFGVHDQSQGSALRRFTSILFWRAFNTASGLNSPLNICHVRLMTRRYVDALCSLPESNVFLGGLYQWVGFLQIAITIDRKIVRERSTYNLWARAKLAVKSIVSFSTVPLKAMFWIGVSISTLSAIMAVYYLALRLMNPGIPLGFTTLIISLWFLSGLIIACLGVIGIYMAYMYLETKGRPRVIVSQVHGIDKQ